MARASPPLAIGLALLLLVPAIVAALPLTQGKADVELFAQFKDHFRVQYGSVQEEAARFAVFKVGVTTV